MRSELRRISLLPLLRCQFFSPTGSHYEWEFVNTFVAFLMFVALCYFVVCAYADEKRLDPQFLLNL
jgi:hypothetical protein